MKQFPSTIIHSLLLFNFLYTGAQKGQAQPAADDHAISRLVHDRCPGADILSIERSGSGLIEAEYLCGTEVVEAGILNGHVIYEEREANLDENVLDHILKSTARSHPDWLIDEIDLISTTDTAFLKVELVMDGLEQNLYFTTTGRKYKPAALLASDGWSLSELKSHDLPNIGYDLLSPDTVHELPDLLREVSGIAIMDERKILCVQDELGAVFVYDMVAGIISDMIRFADVGDFEDIALHNDRIIVLRSDGLLVELDRNDRRGVGERMPSLPSLNYEAAYFDLIGRDLYVVSKEAPVTGPADSRQVHRVKGNGEVELVRTLSVFQVTDALARSQPALVQRGSRFQPSAAAVHPVTQALYVLSASDRLLVVYLQDSLKVHPLPAELFYKPEGIAFLPNGDLMISSEGDKKGLVKGSILRFTFKGM